jgi:hypothetical protein
MQQWANSSPAWFANILSENQNIDIGTFENNKTKTKSSAQRANMRAAAATTQVKVQASAVANLIVYTPVAVHCPAKVAGVLFSARILLYLPEHGAAVYRQEGA